MYFYICILNDKPTKKYPVLEWRSSYSYVFWIWIAEYESNIKIGFSEANFQSRAKKWVKNRSFFRFRLKIYSGWSYFDVQIHIQRLKIHKNCWSPTQSIFFVSLCNFLYWNWSNKNRNIYCFSENERMVLRNKNQCWLSCSYCYTILIYS